VEFLHRLREERKYPDMESLRRQIALDVEHTRTYFSNLSRTLPQTGAAH
jgi:FAD synthase